MSKHSTIKKPITNLQSFGRRVITACRVPTTVKDNIIRNAGKTRRSQINRRREQTKKLATPQRWNNNNTDSVLSEHNENNTGVIGLPLGFETNEVFLFLLFSLLIYPSPCPKLKSCTDYSFVMCKLMKIYLKFTRDHLRKAYIPNNLFNHKKKNCLIQICMALRSMHKTGESAEL